MLLYLPKIRVFEDCLALKMKALTTSKYRIYLPADKAKHSRRLESSRIALLVIQDKESSFIVKNNWLKYAYWLKFIKRYANHLRNYML